MNSCAALYSCGSSIVAGEVVRSTLASCIAPFLSESQVSVLESRTHWVANDELAAIPS